MDTFWNQPDQTTIDNTNEVVPYSFVGAGLNDKGGDNAVNNFGFHMSNGMDFSIGMGSHGNHMPAPAASAPRNFNHMAPPFLSHYDASKGFEDFTYDNDQASATTTQQRITHDDQAASALMSMSSHSQDQSQPPAASGSSWGNININNTGNYTDDQLHMTGDPSSGSATNTPLTPTVTENFQRLGRSTSHSQFPSHGMMPQATQPNNYAHTRHQSLSMGTNGTPMLHSSMNPWQIPSATIGQDQTQTQTQRRPTLYHYGSDQNFSQQGYQTSTAYSASDNKYNNLLSLPLAGLASDSQAPTAATQQAGNVRDNGQQHRNSLPNNLQQLSSAALAHQHTNLAPAASTYPRPASQMYPTHTMETMDQSQQARKRRRSQPEDDAALRYGFGPSNTQTSSNATGRAPVALKQENATEQYQAGYATPPGSSSKRRKSSAQPGTTSNSASASPSTPAATTFKASASSKKRRSETKQPRHNLSDTQKRNNHIASEQKRRDAMKTNYEELNLYVPTLHQGTQGLSRSEILQHSGDWLESLRTGNEAIMAAYGITFDDITEADGETISDD